MKRFNTLLIFFTLILGCKGQENKIEEKVSVNEQAQYETFGEKITEDDAEKSESLAAKYQEMQVADSLKIKFKGTVTDVCKVKGCWMKVQLPAGEETMVRFKDYGFFMPNDIVGKEVIVNGDAFVEYMSVEDQKHYAQDAGKSAEEIAQITEPLKTYGFEADGVLIPINQ